jgi:hypothetical protein
MAFTKPTDIPVFATDGVTLPLAGTVNKINPRAILKTQGYDLGNYPTCEETNWQLNSLGMWTEWFDQEVQHLTDTNLAEHTDVASMVADELLSVGSYIRTLGYYTFGDTGGSIYEVQSTGTADGMTVIALTNGLFAHFKYTTNTFSPVQFGARGDGTTDDSIVLQKLLDLGEDNPSNTTLNKGIVIDLNTRNFAVDVTFQSKTTIKNGTLSQTVADVNILQYIGTGTGKSVGWEYLHLDNVIFDGRSLGSGSTNTADGGVDENDFSFTYLNSGICVDTTSIGTNTYGFRLKDCTFKNLYNSAICYVNNNQYTTYADIDLDNCFIGGTTSGDPSTVALIFKSTDAANTGKVQVNIHNSTEINTVNALLYTDSYTKVVFNTCRLITSTSEANLFTGASHFSLINTYTSLGEGFNGGSCSLSAHAYKIEILNSEINTTFQTLLVRSGDNPSFTDVIVHDSIINTSFIVDKTPQGSGQRIGCNVHLSDSTFKKALMVEPDNTFTVSDTINPPSQPLLASESHSITLSGNKISSRFTPNIALEEGIRINIKSTRCDFSCVGNVTYFSGLSDNSNSSLIFLKDLNVMPSSVTGNTFIGLSGGGVVNSVLTTDTTALNVDHKMALAGNMVNQSNNLLLSISDATFLPINYNR